MPTTVKVPVKTSRKPKLVRLTRRDSFQVLRNPLDELDESKRNVTTTYGDLLAQLQQELGGGEATVPAPVAFTNQTTVSITHNLGRLVQVQVYGTTGASIRGEITQSSLNALTILFSQPLSGTVVLR